MKEINCFSKEWFEAHQARLLWFANTRYGRDVLGVNGNNSNVGKNKILKIEPRAIHWVEGNKVKAEFRSKPEFANKMFHSYKALWEAMHWFDMKIANPLVPALNLGFDSLPFYPAAGNNSPIDGYGGPYSASGAAWATLRSAAGSATILNSTGSDINTGVFSDNDTNLWAVVYRGAVLFDISSLEATEITDVALDLRGGALKSNNGGNPEMAIVSSNPAANNALAGTDFSIGNMGTTEFATRIGYSSWSQAAYNPFAFNASGKSFVQSAYAGDGIVKLGLRSGWDIDNSEPTWTSSQGSVLSVVSADAGGDIPRLTITYTPAGGASTLTLMGIG